MKNLQSKIQSPIYIVGVELRTTNDKGRSFKDIPPFWEHFMKENYVSKIPNKLSDDIYAVYTHFENEGKNNFGMYSLIIGYNVTPDPTLSMPESFKNIVIPSGAYLRFPVENGRIDKVSEVWQSIWALPEAEKQDWSFFCEFERYQPSGEIDIYIGLKE